MKRVILTGAAGFIGFFTCQKLLSLGYEVLGIDNLNSYYDVKLKEDRLGRLQALGYKTFHFENLSILDKGKLDALGLAFKPDYIIHLAAQAGVRYSLTHPEDYIQTNVVGFFNIIELSKNTRCAHLVFASSSSVYGLNSKHPFSILDTTDQPASLYAATKKSNELMAHTYAHLHRIPMTGLRFFTVYGPWGRPDMAYFSFTKNILEGLPITVFNNGEMERDFTYIDDIVDGIIGVLENSPNRSSNSTPFQIYNLGHNHPVKLMDFIHTLEKVIGKKANMEFKPMQPGDVLVTSADISESSSDFGFSPKTDLTIGLEKFYHWYKDYYKGQRS